MAKKGQKITFFPAAPEKMVQNKKYFGFFLVSYISIQKKKCTSKQFLQGRPLDVCLSLVLLFTIFVIVVTQKLVVQQSKNVTAKCMETLLPPPSIQYLLETGYGYENKFLNLGFTKPVLWILIFLLWNISLFIILFILFSIFYESLSLNMLK